MHYSDQIRLVYKKKKIENILDAYELRLLDDDDGCKADMTFGAIDKSKLILSTQSDCFVNLINNNTICFF